MWCPVLPPHMTSNVAEHQSLSDDDDELPEEAENALLEAPFFTFSKPIEPRRKTVHVSLSYVRKQYPL